MEFVEAGDLKAPALGFGTWQLTGDECTRGVDHALGLGYRHIDTAQVYENEGEVGQAIADSSVNRGDIFLTTKVWYTRLQPDELIPSVEESLRKLRTDYVDLLLIHWPVDDVPVEETLGAMMSLVGDGKVKHVGVSNFTPTQTREALESAPVACNQVEYHPYLAQPALLELAQQKNFMLTAYSPLARGQVVGDDTLAGIGEKYGKSPVQVTLRWFVQQENVAVIPKAASAKHRESNFDIFDFELTDGDMQTIANLDRGERIISPDWAPDWER